MQRKRGRGIPKSSCLWRSREYVYFMIGCFGHHTFVRGSSLPSVTWLCPSVVFFSECFPSLFNKSLNSKTIKCRVMSTVKWSTCVLPDGVQNYALDHAGGDKIDLLRVHGIPYIILEKRRLPENKQNFETRRSLFKLPTNTCKYLRISQLWCLKGHQKSFIFFWVWTSGNWEVGGSNHPKTSYSWWLNYSALRTARSQAH